MGNVQHHRSSDLPIGLRADICANGETWEFSLTLGGHRVGPSLFRTIEQGHRPNLTQQFEALRDILHKNTSAELAHVMRDGSGAFDV